MTHLDEGSAGHGVVGVIGGMGPLATADFFHKVIACTDAADDAGHVPLVIASDPRIPPRPAALLSNGASPLPALRSIRDRLVAFGARMLVMPCNTAHHWHAELTRDCVLPFPSIIEVSCDEAARGLAAGGRVGIVATRATLAARLFEPALEQRGLAAVLPDDTLLDGFILPSIAAVKAGHLDAARAPMHHAVQALLDQGAERVLLACTEAPIAMGGPSVYDRLSIDTTLALARATVRGWRPCSRVQHERPDPDLTDPTRVEAGGVKAMRVRDSVQVERHPGPDMQDRITIDPAICHGKPCIRGLRYPAGSHDGC